MRGTVGSLGGEAVAAALGAEVEAVSIALELDARRAQGDLHAADRVHRNLNRCEGHDLWAGLRLVIYGQALGHSRGLELRLTRQQPPPRSGVGGP